ncbi:hypothetical protein [Streptomyces sp. DW26H14]|uniref:hypothetical protein n=1 Tax=Streptomyces sp. DW26H14 TaxID=3435395 RepID=UPI00403DDC5F
MGKKIMANSSTRLQPGHYEWAMVVRTLSVQQEHWGAWVLTREATMGEIVEALRLHCAKEMNAAPSVVEVVRSSMTGPS